MRKMTEKQRSSLDLAIKEAVREANLNALDVKRVLINKKDFKRDVIESLLNNSKFDKRFTSFSGFFLKIPQDYDHQKELSLLGGAIEYSDTYTEFIFTDEKFNKVSHAISPNKNYFVRIFEVVGEMVTFSDCLNFLSTEGAVFTGAQGLSLLWRLKKEKLPHYANIFSFDKEGFLPRDRHGLILPCIYRNNSWQLRVKYLRKSLQTEERNCFISFFEE